ncbi:MAG: DNA replication/repair protein RecF [Anaerolineaceae bacterium]|nr:DNA replication/repair protein RecF [Anaerolineaceae bacterium]
MHLERLAVTGLRNLDKVDIQLGSGANLFYGINGSGKTSLLEAVYLLSRGRSFRTRNLKSVIHHQRKTCTCFGSLVDRSGLKPPVGIGVSRSESGDFQFRIAGEPVHTASQLSETLPLQLFNSESFLLLEGSPSHRRRFLDWGVFHVEHDYRALWGRFQRCLKHRNSLLRHGRIDPLQLAVWDREFVQASLRIAEYRRYYLEAFHPVFIETCTALGVDNSLTLSLQAGWDQQYDLEDLLKENVARDRKTGHTLLGPHRADIRLQVEGKLASEILSRGQAKMLVTALKIAQGIYLQRQNGRKCLYLLDDLPAELDANHRQRVGKLLDSLGVQVLMTGVEKVDLQASWPEPDVAAETNRVKVFHVEQGCVRDVS